MFSFYGRRKNAIGGDANCLLLVHLEAVCLGATSGPCLPLSLCFNFLLWPSLPCFGLRGPERLLPRFVCAAEVLLRAGGKTVLALPWLGLAVTRFGGTIRRVLFRPWWGEGEVSLLLVRNDHLLIVSVDLFVRFLSAWGWCCCFSCSRVRVLSANVTIFCLKIG